MTQIRFPSRSRSRAVSSSSLGLPVVTTVAAIGLFLKFGTAPSHTACRDSALPVRLFALGAEALSARASGHNNRICGLRFSAFLVLALVSERPTREVDLRHRLSDDTRAESQRSGAELVHQLRSKPPLWGSPGNSSPQRPLWWLAASAHRPQT